LALFSFAGPLPFTCFTPEKLDDVRICVKPLPFYGIQESIDLMGHLRRFLPRVVGFRGCFC
jgi:hypothetical protein